MNTSFRDVELTDRLFIVGTTLATFSAFRYAFIASELCARLLNPRDILAVYSSTRSNFQSQC